MSIEVKEYNQLSNDVLDYLVSLEEQIFDKPYSREKLEREISTKTNFVLFIAFENNMPIAFKAGYQLTSRLFYSWIGGTVPSARGCGTAKLLMERQHHKVKELGYSCVRTHTENKYKSMLILNIKSGFDIIGVYKSDHDDKQKIILEKML